MFAGNVFLLFEVLACAPRTSMEGSLVTLSSHRSPHRNYGSKHTIATPVFG